MILELCGEEYDGAVCDRLRGHESTWHGGLDADGNWHSWTHGFPGESLPVGDDGARER
jgi:hypothetical protein